MEKQELESLLAEKEIELSKSLNSIKADILNQYRLILEREHTPPESLTVSFDIRFDKL